MTPPPRTTPSSASGRGLRVVAALGVLALLAVGVWWWGGTQPGRQAGQHASETWAYRTGEYQQAVDAAVAWVDELAVDPVALQARGVKGKKKLAEALAVYSIALRYEDDPADLRRFRNRIEELAAMTERPAYHNMQNCDLREFRQNSMSYLRVMWLMERAELDTLAYRDALKAAKDRLDEDLSNRGPWQQAMFARYYDDLGLDKPAALLRDHAELGVVRQRLEAEQYDLMRAYQLTHEIFVAYDYGFARDQETFTPEDLAYLRDVLPSLIDRQIAVDEPDLLSELLTGMALLGWRDHPAARRGVDYLLRHQNANGTWGDYEAERARIGALVDQHLYLHTTLAGIQALLELYERRL